MMKQTTTFEEVRRLAAEDDYQRIPVIREIFSDVRTPLEVLRALQNVSDHCFLLESVEDSRQWGRYTFLGFDPSMELTCKDHVLAISAGGKVTMETEHPGDTIKRIIRENKAPRIPGLPTLTGGLVGYFAYDYIQYAEPSLYFGTKDAHGVKDVDLMLFERMICFDHFRQKIILIDNIRTASLETEYNKALRQLDDMENLVRWGEQKKPQRGRLLEPLKPALSKEAYCRGVEKVKEHIREGDIFQLVYSNPMKAPFEGSLLDTYRVLRTTNPSPYMFYFSGDDVEIAGASPETLVKVEGRTIRTFPLAGTRPRGTTDEEDARLEKELLADEKECAEHNMLVDLGRNDLGKLCEFGSVSVEKYMGIARFSHVMHIGSAIRGTLRQEVDALDAIDAVLPAGTLSGAPKLRACQLIDAIEGDRRGIYGGAIGYVDFTGNLDVCIGIRLAWKKDGCVFVRAGAGIVADSVAENEYQECINKARAVVDAIEQAQEDAK
jgi:anthranilate synthase component 1